MDKNICSSCAPLLFNRYLKEDKATRMCIGCVIKLVEKRNNCTRNNGPWKTCLSIFEIHEETDLYLERRYKKLYPNDYIKNKDSLRSAYVPTKDMCCIKRDQRL